ncbi:MAG: hybrid cluster-associated redox disulfide protein [Myxococcota bacterium]|jgi:hybrid cluster-associated redox disulfide protein
MRVLSERRDPLDELQGSLESSEGLLSDLEARLITTDRALAGSEADLRLSREPFSGSMTVDQAWRKHPGTRAVFTRHHLPGCDGCAVRFDETLTEAAAAYGLDLEGLLEELGALL